MVFNMNNTTDIFASINSSALQQNGVPIYIQLIDFLRRNIETGLWPLGGRLPSLEKMADAFGVSRVTMRQAIQMLVQAGLLVSCQGRGTFITQNLPQRPYENLKTSWAELIRKIEGTEVRLLEEDSRSTCPLHCPIGGVSSPQLYHYMKRLHSQKGAPYAVIEVYLDELCFQKAPDTYRTLPVLSVLGTQNIVVPQARQLLTIDVADAESASLLDLTHNAPVVRVQRFAVNTDQVLFYVGNVVYRGDYVRLDIDLTA